MKVKHMKHMTAWAGFALLMFALNACSVTGAGVHVGSKGPVVKSGPPPHAPAHGYRAKYKYYYYPDAYVYFDISRGIYFYLEGETWVMSVSLPRRLRISLGDGVMIEMETDRPYTRFAYHKAKYPPGQLKKKKNWVKKNKW